ncbi:PEP-CTERM sorting domain-containing protein [Duganella sp. FT135W]|uniref:PEP-CTERM sorting domain-containing protein n=1 Tax=Duganella flavida TaxID=2692175 RepID=A0A6L8K3S7_9BURK|nr:PEP-CTERM sorting domain-containing protein [Duganella flavida]MYM21555.1 PEP-CTERM sorting domain-containing protein [Duganella flavida]
MRRKNMHQLKLAVASLAFSAIAMPAMAEIIDFDDVNGFGDPLLQNTFVDPGYHGFNLTGGFGSSSWVISTAKLPTFPQDNAHSGKLYAYSNAGTDLHLDSVSGTFRLNDFWARSGDNDTPYSLVVTAYKGGAEVFSQTLAIDTTYKFYSMNLVDVDSVRFSTNGATNLLLDDISVNAPTPVPEPATWGMLVAGLAIVAGVARRKKKLA